MVGAFSKQEFSKAADNLIQEEANGQCRLRPPVVTFAKPTNPHKRSSASSSELSRALLCNYFNLVSKFCSLSSSLANSFLTYWLVKYLIGNGSHSSDWIPIFCFMKVNRCISFPLCIILNKSLKDCHFGRLWQQALVIRIHKSNGRMLTTNYHSISLLSFCSWKICQRLFDHSLWPRYLKNNTTLWNIGPLLPAYSIPGFLAKNPNFQQKVHIICTDFC